MLTHRLTALSKSPALQSTPPAQSAAKQAIKPLAQSRPLTDGAVVLPDTKNPPVPPKTGGTVSYLGWNPLDMFDSIQDFKEGDIDPIIAGILDFIDSLPKPE